MKTLIITEAGSKFGFGHLTRCYAIMQALMSHDSRNCVKFMLHGDSLAAKYAKKLNIRAEIVNWHKDHTAVYERARKYHAVILDSYYAQKILYDTLGRTHGRRLLIMDDYARFKYQSGLVLNPIMPTTRFSRLRPSTGEHLGGCDSVVLRKAFWKCSKRKVKRRINHIVLTFGATMNKSFLNRLIKYLLQRGKFQLHVIYPQPLKALKRVTVYRNMGDLQIKKIMAKCDLAISAAGQTLLELASCGTPTIAIEIADNQKANLKMFQSKKMAEVIRSYTKKYFWMDLEKAFEKVQNITIRKRLSAGMQENISGKGALRIARKLIRETKKRGKCAI